MKTLSLDLNTREYANDDLPLKPWQRIATSLFATGMPIHDISPQVNQPIAEISSWLTSTRAAALINDLLRENTDRIDDLLEAAAVDSLLTLMRIRDTSPNDAHRIAASREILSKTLPGVKARDSKRANELLSTLAPEDEIAKLREQVKAV